MITVSHLTKRYGAHTAVSDVSFTIEKGKVYGFLGPNGAGKSTTMNIITGCLAATEGEVTIDGHDIFEEPLEAKKRIGYLPEIPPLYTDMTPTEYLRFIARARGFSGAEARKQMNAAMERARITEVKDRLIRNLSKGYRQRVPQRHQLPEQRRQHRPTRHQPQSNTRLPAETLQLTRHVAVQLLICVKRPQQSHRSNCRQKKPRIAPPPPSVSP